MRRGSSELLLLVLLLLLASSAGAVFTPLYVDITHPAKPEALGSITLTSVAAGQLSIECSKAFYDIFLDDHIPCVTKKYSLNDAPLLILITIVPLSQETTAPIHIYVDVPTKNDVDIRLATIDCLQPLPDKTCRIFMDTFQAVDMCNAPAKDAAQKNAILKGDADCVPLPPMPTAASPSSVHPTAVTTASATFPSSATDGTTTTKSPKSAGGNKILHDFADSPITSDNVTEVLRETLSVVKDYNKLTPEDISALSLILEHATALHNLTSETTTLVLDVVDMMLNADADVFRESSSPSALVAFQSANKRLINLERKLVDGVEKGAAAADSASKTPSQRILDSLEMLVAHSVLEVIEFLNSTNIGFRSSKLTTECNGEMKQGTFTIVDKERVFSGNSDETEKEGSRSISMARSVICNSNASHSIVSITRSLKLYSSPSENYASISLFPHGRRNRSVHDPPPCAQQIMLEDGGAVLAATLLVASKEDAAASGNQHPQRISRLASAAAPMARIQLNDMRHAAWPLHASSYGVTWWTGARWSETDQCTVTQTAYGITADCPHLTDFTLIIDGVMNDPMVCSAGLFAFSEVISTFSILSLLAVISFTSVRIAENVPQARAVRRVVPWLVGRHVASEAADLDGTLLSLAQLAALFSFHAIFAIFSLETVAGAACSTFAAIIYTLLLITINFTLFASLRTLLIFFPAAGQNSRVSAFAIRVLILLTRVECIIAISAGLPVVLSVCLLAFTPFFNRNDGLCWVRADFIAPAVVLPTTLTALNGALCLVLIAFRILPLQKQLTSRDFLKRIISLFLMQFTLGLPWCVQFFSLYFTHVSFWHVLFTLVIGSQGVVMLLLYLYKALQLTRTNARDVNNMREEQSTQKMEISVSANINTNNNINNISEIEEKLVNTNGQALTFPDEKLVSTNGQALTFLDEKLVNTNGQTLTFLDEKLVSTNGQTLTFLDEKLINTNGQALTFLDEKLVNTNGQALTFRDEKLVNTNGQALTFLDEKLVNTNGQTLTFLDEKLVSTNGQTLTFLDEKLINTNGQTLTFRDEILVSTNGQTLTIPRRKTC